MLSSPSCSYFAPEAFIIARIVSSSPPPSCSYFAPEALRYLAMVQSLIVVRIVTLLPEAFLYLVLIRLSRCYSHRQMPRRHFIAGT